MKAYLKLHMIIFIWGFTAVLGALIQLDYFSLTWYRMGIAAAFLLVYLLRNKKSRKSFLNFDIQKQKQYILGGVIIALHWIAFFYAIKVSNVSITLVALSSGAFFTSIIEPLLFKRKVLYYEILLGILILLGFFLLFKTEHIAFTGVIYALIAAFLSGLFSVINGIYVQKQDAYILSFYQLFYGFVFLSIVMFLMYKFPATPSHTDWIYLIILASICTAYAFSASIEVMKQLSPYTVMISINLEPVYGIILAVIVLGDKEKMSEGFYLGASLILIIILLNVVIKYLTKKTAVN